MIRAIIQLLLCVGVLPFYPFVLLLVASAFTPESWGDLSSFSFENWAVFMIYLAAVIGVPALFISIFAPPDKIKETHWLRNLVIAGLIGGSLTAVTFLAFGVLPDAAKNNWHSLLSGIWEIGGPLIVALWNLWRLWKEPNKRFQPTQVGSADLSG